MGPARPEATAAASAVRAALALARAGTGAVRDKPGRRRDVVTDTDVAVEDLVRAELGAATGLTVVGEERGGEPAKGAAYWMVDPICGTRNFASGVPLYAVNLALVEDGELTLAAVGDGSTGAVFLAERGRGAFVLEGAAARPLSVNPASATVAVGIWPQGGPARARAAAFAAALVDEDRHDLRIYATTLGLAYLACGRIGADVYFAAGTLHFGAGALLAEEAGARVTELDGSPWRVRSSSLLASASAELHEDLLALLDRTGARPRP